ncbi:MAG: Wzz/FepE/Etk N-terminal domain-containing protein [Firmicutes bacterium]|nr:Wzz/FepE/Etk N-terminal domain-containing protein [Bacillota bacterium]
MEEFKELNLSDLFKKIKKRWKLILVITVVSVIITYGVNVVTAKPIYESNLKVLVVNTENNQEVVNTEIINYVNLMNTYISISKTDSVNELAATKYSEINESEYESSGTVTLDEGTMILNINLRNGDAKDAFYGVKAFYSSFSEVASIYLEDWKLVKIEDPKLPVAPVNSDITQSLINAFVVSLLASVTLAIVLEYFSTKKSEDK